MKNSLIFLLLMLSVFSILSSCDDSATVTNTPLEEIEDKKFEVEGLDTIPLEVYDTLSSGNSEVANMLRKFGSSDTDAELLTSDCEECQSCNGIGGYSQISIGGPYIIFNASTFIQGSNPMCPCFADITGTVTFEYQISTNPAGQVITQGSVTQPLVNGQSAGYCGFDYPGGILTNEFRYPDPGEPVSVNLKTTHVAGSHPSQTFVHETWTY